MCTHFLETTYIVCVNIACFYLLVRCPKPHRLRRTVSNALTKGWILVTKRNRTVRLVIDVTEEEKKIITENMRATGTENFSLYARKMLMDGYIVKRDFSALKEFTKVLGDNARNIHQIAKRANETRNIYAQDLEDIRRTYNEVCSMIKEQIVKVIRG